MMTPIDTNHPQPPRSISDANRDLTSRVIELSIFKIVESILGNNLETGYGDVIKSSTDFKSGLDALLKEKTSRGKYLLSKHCLIPSLNTILSPTMRNIFSQIEKKLTTNITAALESPEKRASILNFVADKVDQLFSNADCGEISIDYNDLAKELINEFFPKPLLKTKEKIQEKITMLEEQIRNVPDSSVAPLLKGLLGVLKTINQFILRLIIIPLENVVNFTVKNLSQFFANNPLASIIELSLGNIKNLIVAQKGFDADIQKLINDEIEKLIPTDAAAGANPAQAAVGLAPEAIALGENEQQSLSKISDKILTHLTPLVSSSVNPSLIQSLFKETYLPIITKAYSSLLNEETVNKLTITLFDWAKLGVEMVGNSSPEEDPSPTINAENRRSSALIADLIKRNAHIPSDVLYDRGSSIIESYAQSAHGYFAATADEPGATLAQKTSYCLRWAGRMLAGSAVEASRAIAYTVLGTSAVITHTSAQFIAAEGSAPLAETIITPAIKKVKGQLLNPKKIDAIIREVLTKIHMMLAQ